jgi:O-acetylhomoserine (thiol)-lyase
LKLIRRATNLFENKSLAIHPASTIFGTFTPDQLSEMNVCDRTIRLSVGLDDADALLADIRQALAAE